jgi:hypothetical protein
MKLRHLLIISIAGLLLASCSDDSKKRKETLEIFSIELGKDSLGVGNLTYKDVKYFDTDGYLYKQEFYNKFNELQGTEYIDRNKKEKHSEYFATDSTLLSYYNLVYEYDLLKLKSAFDGGSDQFLRAEQYKYDHRGNRLEKTILDENGAVNRVYKFIYDKFGNETGFSGFDENGKVFLIETYKITNMDKKNRWTEKWGYRDNVPYTYSKRTISK